MTRWIAFLRAINVGGHVVKMERLRALFEQCGFGNVATFIASGNVMFDAPSDDRAALEQQIEQHLLATLGYDVRTFLRTPAETVLAVEAQPFPADMVAVEGTQLYVMFLKTAPGDDARLRVAGISNDIDLFEIVNCELYWLSRRHLGESRMAGAQLERALRMPGTARNISTVRKLAAKYGSPGQSLA